MQINYKEYKTVDLHYVFIHSKLEKSGPNGEGCGMFTLVRLWYLGDHILLWNLKKFDEKSRFHNNDIELLDHHNYINWVCSPAGLSDHLVASGHGSSMSWDLFGYLEIRLVFLRVVWLSWESFGYLETWLSWDCLVILRLAWLEILNLLHSILHPKE